MGSGVGRARWSVLGVVAALVVGVVVAVVSMPATASAGTSTLDCSGDNFAPASRDVAATKIVQSAGGVAATTVPTTLASSQSITIDFGKEVGGTLTVAFGAASTGTSLSVGFNESLPNANAGGTSDWSYGGTSVRPTANTSWTSPVRGGFRYVTLSAGSSSSVTINAVTVHNDFDPNRKALNQYPNTFCSSDDLLNKIWYAGAYTVQTDTIPSTEGFDGSSVVGPTSASGTVPVLTDGAKRDRMVWVGDLSVELATAYSALGDLTPSRNALVEEYSQQLSSGELPYSGQAGNDYWALQRSGSETYSMWGVIDTANYVRYSGDIAFARTYWNQYLHALNYSLNHVSSTNGLMTVDPSQTADWARDDTGGQNIEANELLYECLLTGSQLATAVGDATDASTWTSDAAALKTAINTVLWNDGAGEFQDNPSNSTLFPQDGNSLALWFGVADSAHAARIASALQAQVGPNWAVTPELASTGKIGTFPASMEVEGLLSRGFASQAEALMRTEWGYMLNSPQGSGSTFWEGMDTSGTLNYGEGGSATSASHGWATGPTSAMTFYLLGIRPGSLSGDYAIAPNPGSVAAAQGTLTTPSGVISQSWTNSGGAFSDTYAAPAGTVSHVVVPAGANEYVTVNGTPVWSAGSVLDAAYAPVYDPSSGTVSMSGMPASATVVVTARLQAQPSLSPAPNAAGWVAAPSATVSWNWADGVPFTSSGSNCPASTTVPGSAQVTVRASCTDSAGQTVTAQQQVMVDGLAPVANPQLSPPPNSAGWNNGTTTVLWNWADDPHGSGLSRSCPSSTQVTTSGTVTATCTDVAGNVASASVQIRIDTAAPVATPSTWPPTNASGWTRPDGNGNVTLSWNWSDAGGSKITSQSATNCPASTVLAQRGVRTLQASCVDAAGNLTRTSATVKVDGTAPTDAPTISPAPNSHGWVTSGPVTVTWNWRDADSGLDTSNGGCPARSTVPGSGVVTLTPVCLDRAGNASQVALTVSVDSTAPAANPTISSGVVRWSWTDPESGTVNCPSTSPVPAPGKTVTASCQNVAGLTGTASYTAAAAGAVHGMITDTSNGAAIGGVCVTAAAVGTSTAVAQVCTDNSGAYRLATLPPGTYTLTFTDTSGGHVAQTRSATVTANGDLTVNAALAQVATGNITGTVTDASGKPIPNLCAYAQQVNSGPGAIRACTNASGVYVFTGLPAGQYAVFFGVGEPVPAYAPQWFDNGSPSGGQKLVTVQPANVTTGGIDATMQPATLNTLSGTVTDAATGAPVAGVCIDLYLYSSDVTNPANVINKFGGAAYQTCTASDGTYHLDIVADGVNYAQEITDPQGRYPDYWNESHWAGPNQPLLMTPINVTNGPTTISTSLPH